MRRIQTLINNSSNPGFPLCSKSMMNNLLIVNLGCTLTVKKQEFMVKTRTNLMWNKNVLLKQKIFERIPAFLVLSAQFR